MNPGTVAAAAALLVGAAATVSAQGTTQFAGTGTITWPYSRGLTFVGEVNPAVLLSGDPDWQELGLDAGVEWEVHPNIDLLGYGYLIFTDQDEAPNTTEIRLRVGALPHWRPKQHSRVFFQGRAIAEVRSISYEGGGDDRTGRLRLRAFTRYTIRGNYDYSPGAWYLRGDMEGFIPLGDEAREAFFDKTQLRGGVGHRFDAHHQLEFDLVRRATRQTLGDGDDNVDLVIEARYTYVLPRREAGFVRTTTN
jgi:Protein of unknown function (DUF2490)